MNGNNNTIQDNDEYPALHIKSRIKVQNSM
jgi:hypothetical protein